MSNCRSIGHLYKPRVKIKEKEMIMCCSSSHVKENDWCCTRSSLTSLLAQEKIQTKSPTFWTQIRTAQTHLTSNGSNFCIRTPNRVNLFLLESLSRELSNTIGFTFKFIRSVEISPKQSERCCRIRVKLQVKRCCITSTWAHGPCTT